MIMKWLGMILILVTITTACSSGGSGEHANQEKQTAKGGRVIVTMSIQEPNAFYQILEKRFEEKHPEIDLRIQSYKQTEGEAWAEGDFEKYQKTINTNLLSGKGPDIIDIGGLPIDEYVDKKFLLNMDDYMKQDQTLNKSDFEMNVLNAFKLNGGTYAIPSGFFMRAFVGDGDVISNTSIDDEHWNWEQFSEISKEMIQQEDKSGKDHRYALSGMLPEELLQEIVVDRYTEFVDHAGRLAKFDSPLFVDLIQQIKKMYDDKVVITKPSDNSKPTLFYDTFLLSPADFVNGLHAIFSNPKLLQKPHIGQAGGVDILPSLQYAIQAKSSVKAEAWKFMSFLLSEDWQSLPERDGFSLLKSVNDKKLNDIQEQVNSGTYKLPDGKAVKVSDKEFTQFKQMIHTASEYPTGVDVKVTSILKEELRSFFSGQKSAEEVAKLIQSRTTTYLNE